MLTLVLAWRLHSPLFAACWCFWTIGLWLCGVLGSRKLPTLAVTKRCSDAMPLLQTRIEYLKGLLQATQDQQQLLQAVEKGDLPGSVPSGFSFFFFAGASVPVACLMLSHSFSLSDALSLLGRVGVMSGPDLACLASTPGGSEADEEQWSALEPWKGSDDQVCTALDVAFGFRV
eukprot:2939207-Rhodomonas_salina.1